MRNFFLKIVFAVFLGISPQFSFAAGDILTPPTSGATILQGVNWGNISGTDHSINISGARLIPFPPATGQKNFQVEYGTFDSVMPNGNLVNMEFIGYLNNGQVFTLNNPPNYDFGMLIPNLMPGRNFYFDIVEVSNVAPLVATSLLTYGVGQTSIINDVLNYNFPSSNSLRVYGNLINSAGTGVTNTNIYLEILDSVGNILTWTYLTTGSGSITNGNAYFENTFTDLLNLNITESGGPYTIMLKHTQNGSLLTQPVEFTVPSPGNGGNASTTPPGGGPTVQNTAPGGLVPCINPEDCNFDKLIILVNNVVDFLIFVIGFPLVAIIAAWAGILLLTSGGSTGARDKAKSMFGHVVLGLILALLAWGIIKLILVTFGYQGPLIAIFGIG